MERSETEIDEINYERSTTNAVYSNETIILTDLLHSTPVDGDHEFFDAMERSETEIDEINYERSTTNNVYSNETIILTDLLHSTPVDGYHEFVDAMERSETEIDEINYERSTTNNVYSNETIILTDLLHSTPVEGDHEFFDAMERSETEIDESFCRNTKLEDEDEPFCRSTKSTSNDRFSNRVWSLPDMIPELNKDDISSTPMKADSEVASNSLKNGSDNGSWSLPSSSNSLNNYFSKLLSGYEFSTDEKMLFEMLRVQSFQDLPASCNVSTLHLAQTGFFSSGSGDEVTCFSCGVKYKGWQNNDNPNDVHRRISSDCRMVNGRETRNIPVSQQNNGIMEHTSQQVSLAHTTNGILCTEYSADDMSHAIQRYKMDAIHREYSNNDMSNAIQSYKMDAIHRGIAVIINNEIFTNNPNGTPSMLLGNRTGTHRDAGRLEILWRNLGFEVDFHENKTSVEMHHIAINTARRNHREYDCLVFCILTHGGDFGILYGTDGRPLHIHKITELFHSNRCPNLAGKPKLFFIQACQGILNQTGLVVSTDADDDPAEIPVNSNSQNRLPETIPNDADFLISYATVPGCVSFRCPTNGAWYIRSLFFNLTKYAQRYDLMTILSRVSSDVGEDETTEGDITYKQTPIHMTTLRKPVHFSCGHYMFSVFQAQLPKDHTYPYDNSP